MAWVRGFCFRHWQAMLLVAVLMYALQAVGSAEGKRAVKRWLAEGVVCAQGE